MSGDDQRPVGVFLAVVLLACSLSPLFLAAQTAEARLEGSEPINGNQELIAHPSLPYFYYGEMGKVTYLDYGSRAEGSLALGASGYPSSMDINVEGTLLAVAYSSTIYFLSLSSGAPISTSSIPSGGGNVKSLCFGPGSGIYVTYESSTSIDAYTVSGRIGTVAVTDSNCILEADDSRTVLLAGNMGSPDGTTLIKYGLTSDPSTGLVESGRYVSSTGKLAQFEATNDRVFIACTDWTGIQVVSLDTMTLQTTCLMQGSPAGVAASRDGSVIYGVSTGGIYPPGTTAAIYAFDDSGHQLSAKYVNSVTGSIAPAPDKWAVAIAAPLRTVIVGPEIEASAPTPGSVYAYSPGYVHFNISHDPVIDASAVVATVDGTERAVVRMTSQTYQINLTSTLTPGSHEVSVSVPWGGTSVPASWTFTSGSSDPSALRPALSLIEPTNNSVIADAPARIVLGVNTPEPPPFKTEVTIELNGLGLSAVADLADAGRYIATLPSGLDLTGPNTLNASVNVDGTVITASWKFEVNASAGLEEPFEMIAYGDNFSIPCPTAWTEQRDFSGWELAITGPSSDGISTNVFVDIIHDRSVRADREYIDSYAQTMLADIIRSEDGAEMVGEVNHTAISNHTAGVWKILLTEKGVQEAYALIVDEINGDLWLIKCSASDTSFIDIWPVFEHMISGVQIDAAGSAPVVVPPGTQGYAYFRMRGDYELMIPDNWTMKREATIGEATASLKLTGPKVGEFHVTILLQNETDPSIQDDPASMLAMAETRFLPQLEAKGINALMYEEPRLLNISGHPAVVFSIQWSDLQNNMSVVQEIYYILDEQNQRYWMFTCESPEGSYPDYVQIFDKVAQSFAPIDRSTTVAPGSLLSDPATVLMLAVLGITGAAAGVVFLAAKRYRSR